MKKGNGNKEKREREREIKREKERERKKETEKERERGGKSVVECHEKSIREMKEGIILLLLNVVYALDE